MGNKSIIDVEINDENFKAFLDAFHEFRAEMGDVPKDWDNVTDAMDGSRKKIRDLTKEQKAALGATEKQMHKTASAVDSAAKSQGKFTREAKSGTKAVKALGMAAAAAKMDAKGLAMSFAGIAGTILAAGVALAKLQNEMANAALKRQMSARELGMSPAKMKAFENVTQRYLPNSKSFLTEIENAKQNPQEAIPLLRLGISERKIQQDSVSKLAFLTTEKMHAFYNAQPKATVGLIDQTAGLGNLGSTSQWRLIGNTPMGDLAASAAAYHERAKQFHIGTKDYNAAAKLAVNENALGILAKTKGIQSAAWAAPVAEKANSAAIYGLGHAAVGAADAVNGFTSAMQHVAVVLLGKQAGNNGHLAVLKGQMERAQGTSRYPAARAAYEQFKASQGAAAKALRPYASDIEAAAKASGVKRSVIAGEIWAESGGKANAVSAGRFRGKDGKWHHAHGIGQFRRSTWNEFAGGLPYSDANDPKDAIMVMGRFIAANMKNHKTNAGLESAYSGDQRGSAALTRYQAANQVGASGWGALLSTLQEIAKNTAKPTQVHVHNAGTAPGSRVALSAHAAGHG
ncbi:MAG: transglycosylase SLT domain-containing protein [Acidobacteriaceae bacterium]